MDLKNLTVFSLVNQNMRYLAAKEKVIAANIANASTPNYLAQDIEKPSFLNNVQETKTNLTLHTTHSKHFAMLTSKAEEAKQRAEGFVVYTPRPENALTIDGNGVVLEDQMNEASKTSADYKRMVTIYNSYKNMLSLANTKING